MDAFDGLVKNAMSFLNRSVEEVESSPHYSIIHLAVALELFLKARLAKEHWVLIFQDPGRADHGSLETGSFQSVGISDAIARIENVLGERFTTREKRAFERVRDHRNQLVHAYDPRFSGTISPEVIRKAVAEQSLVWYYLSGLLRDKWADLFGEYATDIGRFTQTLHTKGHLLRGRFEELRPSIEQQVENGTPFHGCPVCQYKAAREKTLSGDIIELECLLCSDVTKALRLSCQECDGVVIFQDLNGVCQNEECGQTIDIGEAIDLLSPSSSKDYYLLDSPATCEYCEHHPESVVPWGDEFLCLACLEEHETITVCQYCGCGMTGDTGSTYAFGCSMCGGSIGADRS